MCSRNNIVGCIVKITDENGETNRHVLDEIPSEVLVHSENNDLTDEEIRLFYIMINGLFECTSEKTIIVEANVANISIKFKQPDQINRTELREIYDLYNKVIFNVDLRNKFKKFVEQIGLPDNFVDSLTNLMVTGEFNDNIELRDGVDEKISIKNIPSNELQTHKNTMLVLYSDETIDFYHNFLHDLFEIVCSVTVGEEESEVFIKNNVSVANFLAYSEKVVPRLNKIMNDLDEYERFKNFVNIEYTIWNCGEVSVILDLIDGIRDIWIKKNQ
jgi:hypothetical protein